jgi:hypothetical protein
MPEANSLGSQHSGEPSSYTAYGMSSSEAWLSGFEKQNSVTMHWLRGWILYSDTNFCFIHCAHSNYRDGSLPSPPSTPYNPLHRMASSVPGQRGRSEGLSTAKTALSNA